MTNDELCRIECEMSRERRPLNDVVLKLCHEYRVMRVDRRGLVSLLHDVILQACPTASSLIDSMAIPEYAAAIKFLDEEGMLMVDTDIGRRVKMTHPDDLSDWCPLCGPGTTHTA